MSISTVNSFSAPLNYVSEHLSSEHFQSCRHTSARNTENKRDAHLKLDSVTIQLGRLRELHKGAQSSKLNHKLYSLCCGSAPIWNYWLNLWLAHWYNVIFTGPRESCFRLSALLIHCNHIWSRPEFDNKFTSSNNTDVFHFMYPINCSSQHVLPFTNL